MRASLASIPRQVAWTVAKAAERIEAADAEKGVDAARRAVRLDPGNFDAQLALARGLIRTRRRGGRPAGRTAAPSDLRPGDPDAREAMADALWLAERESAAFDELRRLAAELSGPDRERVLAKARSLYRERAGWLGRRAGCVASGSSTFALRRGWLRVR